MSRPRKNYRRKPSPLRRRSQGKRNRAEDQKALNQAHDFLVKAGANCEAAMPDEKAEDDTKALDTSKAQHPTARPNLRLLTEIAELESSSL
jgi:hypothetical protein